MEPELRQLLAGQLGRRAMKEYIDLISKIDSKQLWLTAEPELRQLLNENMDDCMNEFFDLISKTDSKQLTADSLGALLLKHQRLYKDTIQKKEEEEHQLKVSYNNRDIDDIVSFIEGDVSKTKTSKMKKGQQGQKVKAEGENKTATVKTVQTERVLQEERRSTSKAPLKLAEPREDTIPQAVDPSETGTRPKVRERKPKSKSDQLKRSKPTVKVEKPPQAASAVNLGYTAAPQSRVENVNKVQVNNLNPEKEDIPGAGKKPAMWKQDYSMCELTVATSEALQLRQFGGIVQESKEPVKEIQKELGEPKVKDISNNNVNNKLMHMLDFITVNIAEKEFDLECPICMDLAQPPIYMCRDSHLICNICAPLMAQCPTCWVPFNSPILRNRMAERCLEDLQKLRIQRDNLGEI